MKNIKRSHKLFGLNSTNCYKETALKKIKLKKKHSRQKTKTKQKEVKICKYIYLLLFFSSSFFNR